jgi:hypothetical protein
MSRKWYTTSSTLTTEECFGGFQAKSFAWGKALACLTNVHSLSSTANENHVGNEGTKTTFPNLVRLRNYPGAQGKLGLWSRKLWPLLAWSLAACTLPAEVKLLCNEAVKPTREGRKPPA